MMVCLCWGRDWRFKGWGPAGSSPREGECGVIGIWYAPIYVLMGKRWGPLCERDVRVLNRYILGPCLSGRVMGSRNDTCSS